MRKYKVKVSVNYDTYIFADNEEHATDQINSIFYGDDRKNADTVGFPVKDVIYEALRDESVTFDNLVDLEETGISYTDVYEVSLVKPGINNSKRSIKDAIIYLEYMSGFYEGREKEVPGEVKEGLDLLRKSWRMLDDFKKLEEDKCQTK